MENQPYGFSLSQVIILCLASAAIGCMFAKLGMEAEFEQALQKQRLVDYCQQPGASETMCFNVN